MVTLVKDSHSEKASLAMLVRDAGKAIFGSLEHSSNAFWPMLATPLEGYDAGTSAEGISFDIRDAAWYGDACDGGFSRECTRSDGNDGIVVRGCRDADCAAGAIVAGDRGSAAGYGVAELGLGGVSQEDQNCRSKEKWGFERSG